MQNGKAASWSGGCRPGRLALRGVSGQVPERLADQNSGPRVGWGGGGIRGGCFHSVSNTNGNGASGGQAPLCRPAFLDQLSSWEPGPPSEGPGGVRQTQGAGLGQLGHGDSPMTSPRGGPFRESQGQSVVRLPLPMSQGRSRRHHIPYVSSSSGHLSAYSPSYNLLIL